MTVRIVILGAGFGGISAAIELTRAAGELATVTLIDREAEYAMGLTKLWVATGERTAKECLRSRERLTRHGVDVSRAEIKAIDPIAKVVQTDVGSVAYDRLIVALGLKVDPSLVSGLSEHGSNLYSMDGAERIAQKLREIEGNVVIAISAVPFKCPPAPYEAAMMIDHMLKSRRGAGPARVTVTTPEPRPMPILPPEVGERVVTMLDERGIAFMPERKIAEVESGTLRFEDGSEVAFDLLLAVPPHRPPAFLADVPGLTDASGLVAVDRETLTTAIADVYAIGDVAKVTSFTDLPIPRAGILAEAQARVVATNIAAELRGQAPEARFDGRGYCFVEVGGGRALKAEGEFLAQPHPIAHLGDAPSEAGYAEKLAFERERLDAWFGA